MPWAIFMSALLLSLRQNHHQPDAGAIGSQGLGLHSHPSPPTSVPSALPRKVGSVTASGNSGGVGLLWRSRASYWSPPAPGSPGRSSVLRRKFPNFENIMALNSSPPNPQSFKLILGSSSVARRHILTEMGFDFQVMTADIDEKSIRREKPEELVMVLAEAKADAITSRMNMADYEKECTEPTLLITSDIVVVHEGIIREKPTNKEEARQFLKGYSGGHVSTVGCVVVTNLTTGKRLGSLDKAEVYFHDIPDEVIENLIDEGVVFKVAGGLLLEHPLTLPFVEAVVGSTDSVMGLSKDLTSRLICEALSP